MCGVKLSKTGRYETLECYTMGESCVVGCADHTMYTLCTECCASDEGPPEYVLCAHCPAHAASDEVVRSLPPPLDVILMDTSIVFTRWSLSRKKWEGLTVKQLDDDLKSMQKYASDYDDAKNLVHWVEYSRHGKCPVKSQTSLYHQFKHQRGADKAKQPSRSAPPTMDFAPAHDSEDEDAASILASDVDDSISLASASESDDASIASSSSEEQDTDDDVDSDVDSGSSSSPEEALDVKGT